MSQGEIGWRLYELNDAFVELRVRMPQRALELARSLLRSKPVVARAFNRGQLTRRGERLSREDVLVVGDVVRLEFWRDANEQRQLSAVVVPTLVYQDSIMLAVDKPAGLLVHGDGTGAPTLSSCVEAMLSEQGRRATVQAVQRLDVETTGLVLFSLTEEFQPALDAQIANHSMRKRYLAIVRGTHVASRTGWRTIDVPIGRDRHDAQRMRVSRTGKPSVTRVRELVARDGQSLLLVELETGRRHQIRVHLAHVGHPIMGDGLYGGARNDQGLMLHAWEERLTHPLTGAELVLRTGWPERFNGYGPLPTEVHG